ncbi:hypothetical protein APHAL10511_005980 [Amanita phalloides]|nr:hypothetical protein APHAL10511_005980 [Amanita phalloides]
MATTHGFPPGYFVIKSIACDRALDVAQDEIEDGTELLLWIEKEKSLVETLRDPNANNQVFFIDASGALCSRASGHAIDVENGRLVLRHRRPVSYPYPNSYSHPLPMFSFSKQTGEIAVTFESDPSYPYPSRQPSEAWRNKRYLLTSVPLRRPRTIMEDASDIISNAITLPLAGLSSIFAGSNGTKTENADDRMPARPDEVFDGEIDLKENEVVEEERGAEGEVDDSPELYRNVVVVGVAADEGVSRQARSRRIWTVLPLRRLNARTSHSVT